MSRSAGGICGSWDNSTFNIAVKRHLVNLRETRKNQRTKGSLTEYIGARSEAGCFMHYFEGGWNYQLRSTFAARSLAWGKHDGGEAMDRGLRQHIASGIGCGGCSMAGGHRLPLCGHYRSLWVTA